MIMEGCQGKKDIAIMEKICPRCGHVIEIFSVDVSMTCENCGYTIYNDTLNCVQWCQYARKCVGEELYDRYMEIAESQKKRREEEKAARAEAKRQASEKTKGQSGEKTAGEQPVPEQ